MDRQADRQTDRQTYRQSLETEKSRRALPSSLDSSEWAFEKGKIALGVIANAWEKAQTRERVRAAAESIELEQNEEGNIGQIPIAPSAVVSYPESSRQRICFRNSTV